MKPTIVLPAFCLGLALLSSGATAADAPRLAPEPPSPTSGADTAPAADIARPDATLRFNFRGAPLETVLNYMSEAAGYVIVLDTPVHGTVDMWSAQPVNCDDAVQLLNIALNKNGYTARVKGRTLIVSAKDDAKKRNIPIRTGNDPREIPDNADMVMQIIPLRRIDATQASRDLATLLPDSATLTANADSNSLVVTDTNTNIRHIVELVNALDTSADTVTAMHVFALKNADPVEMAQLLTNLYAPTTSSRGGVAGFGGFGGFGNFGGSRFGGSSGGPAAALAAAAAAGRRGGIGGAGGFGGAFGGSNRRGGGTAASLSTPVTAVADPRTYSVIVTAPKEIMPDIAQMVAQLDGSPARKQKVYVYTMENADVQQVQAILQSLFQSSNQRTNGFNQADPLSQRAQTNTQINATNLQLGTNSTR